MDATICGAAAGELINFVRVKAERDGDGWQIWVGYVITRTLRSKRDAEALAGMIRSELSCRDARWTKAIGYEGEEFPLTPEEAAKWLETDRRKQVNEVKAARQRRGPLHY